MISKFIKFIIPIIALFLIGLFVLAITYLVCDSHSLETCKDRIQIISQIVGILVTLITVTVFSISAFYAIKTYQKSARLDEKTANLERTKWLLSLYEKFYEKEDLKDIRDKLDEMEDTVKLKEIHELVEKEDTKFNDYLNFFEFVAFIKKSKQLNLDEVKAIFEYPLTYLNKHEKVRGYIENKDKGYENLDELLTEIFGKTNKDELTSKESKKEVTK